MPEIVEHVECEEYQRIRNLNKEPYNLKEGFEAIIRRLNTTYDRKLSRGVESVFGVTVFTPDLQEYADQLGIRRNYRV